MRQPLSVAAAPNDALIAIAQPSSPGVTNWMVLRESSSTRSVVSVYVSGAPLSATLVPSTNARSVPWTMAAVTCSVWV